MVKVLKRGDADFYALLGPVFGSREIEKITRDRFYDDTGKIWYVVCGKGAASVLGSTIKISMRMKAAPRGSFLIE